MLSWAHILVFCVIHRLNLSYFRNIFCKLVAPNGRRPRQLSEYRWLQYTQVLNHDISRVTFLFVVSCWRRGDEWDQLTQLIMDIAPHCSLELDFLLTFCCITFGLEEIFLCLTSAIHQKLYQLFWFCFGQRFNPICLAEAVCWLYFFF